MSRVTEGVDAASRQYEEQRMKRRRPPRGTHALGSAEMHPLRLIDAQALSVNVPKGQAITDTDAAVVDLH